MNNFLIGCFGSLSLDMIRLVRSMEREGKIVAPFNDWKHWIVRFLLMLVGGGLAHVHGLSSHLNPVLALQIGATAPAIIEAVSQRPPGGKP